MCSGSESGVCCGRHGPCCCDGTLKKRLKENRPPSPGRSAGKTENPEREAGPDGGSDEK